METLVVPKNVRILGTSCFIGGKIIPAHKFIPTLMNRLHEDPFKVTTRLEVQEKSSAKRWADKFSHAYEVRQNVCTSKHTSHYDVYVGSGVWDYIEHDKNHDEISIIGYHGGKKVVKVPKRIDGKLVTALEGCKEHCACGVFCGCKNIERILLPKSLKKIGRDSFYDCKKLTQIEFYDEDDFYEEVQLESIGKCAFYGCSSLRTIVYPRSYNSLTSFSEHRSSRRVFNYSRYRKTITSSPRFRSSLRIFKYPRFRKSSISSTRLRSSMGIFELPLSLKSIGLGAFHGCKGLTSIVLREKLSSIGEYAFSKCEMLKRVKWSSGVKTISPGLFWGRYKLKYFSGHQTVVEEIAKSAFQDCFQLESFVFPFVLKKIGDGAFFGCKSLKRIGLPSSLESLGEYAFAKCGAIVQVDIPESVVRIEEYAFGLCDKLAKVQLNGKIKYIGVGAFFHDTNLRDVSSFDSLPLEIINGLTFNGCDFNSVTIPCSVRSISAGAFGGNKRLTEVYWGRKDSGSLLNQPANLLNKIDVGAFAGCDKLKWIKLPEGIRYLYADAFSEKTELYVPENSQTEEPLKANRVKCSRIIPNLNENK